MKQSSKLPLVSVIIPTYNRAEIMEISINSVFRQTHSNLEIIIVDDASNDNTKEVVEAINNSKIRYYRHSTNRGGAAARNTGIEAAKGDYIAFLDSDDAWVPNKLELQLSSIQNYSEPQKVVSYTQVFHSHSGISEDTYHNFDEQYFLPARGKQPEERVADYLFCNGGKTLSSTLMLHRSLASATRFQEKFKKHQDWDFCLRLEAQGAIFDFIQNPLTIWNGDPRFEHVGKTADYQFSESWLRECRSYISDKAAAAFSLEKVLPYVMKERQRKFYAQKLIFDAFFQQLISIKRFGRLSIELWIK